MLRKVEIDVIIDQQLANEDNKVNQKYYLFSEIDK